MPGRKELFSTAFFPLTIFFLFFLVSDFVFVDTKSDLISMAQRINMLASNVRICIGSDFRLLASDANTLFPLKCAGSGQYNEWAHCGLVGDSGRLPEQADVDQVSEEAETDTTYLLPPAAIKRCRKGLFRKQPHPLVTLW